MKTPQKPETIEIGDYIYINTDNQVIKCTVDMSVPEEEILCMGQLIRIGEDDGKAMVAIKGMYYPENEKFKTAVEKFFKILGKQDEV